MFQKDRYETSRHVVFCQQERCPDTFRQNTLEQGTAPLNAHKGTCDELATHSGMYRPYAAGADSSTLLMIPKGINGQDKEESQICTIDMKNPYRVFEDAVMVSCGDQNKQATFEHLCLVSQPPVTQKGTGGERARTCECNVQEGEVVPRDRRQVLLCHALLQSPFNRPALCSPNVRWGK